MSLRLDGVTDYAERTTAANLGSTVNCTALMWYRKEDSTNDREILTMGKSGQAGLWQVASSTQVKAHISSEAGVAINMAANSWAGLAITYNSTSGNWIFYFYQDGTLTTVATQYGGSGANTSSLRVGNNDAWGDSASGSNRYLRYWTRELSAAEVQAEFEMTPISGTPAASATNLYLSWPLADSTDTTDWTGNSRAPTISGAATSSEEPTIGGGAESTVTPAPAALAANGRAPSTSIFSAVRIREVLVSESGSVAGDRTGINLAVWYSGVPTGAPDVSLAGLTTDPNGTTSWSIATGGLAHNQAVFMLAYSGSPPDTYTCGRLVPNYE